MTGNESRREDKRIVKTRRKGREERRREDERMRGEEKRKRKRNRKRRDDLLVLRTSRTLGNDLSNASKLLARQYEVREFHLYHATTRRSLWLKLLKI